MAIFGVLTNYDTTTIGIDLGDLNSAICVLDEAGEIVEETKLRTTRDVFARRFESMDSTLIIIETGGHSRWVSAVLKESGHGKNNRVFLRAFR